MLVLLLPLVLFCATLAQGAEYHVATTGSGSTCDLAFPCATLAAAFDEAEGGDTIWIHAGVYDDVIDSETQAISGGSDEATRLKIRAMPGESVTLRPTTCDRVVFLERSAATWLTIDRLIIDAVNCTGDAVKITWSLPSGTGNDSHHIRFQYSEIMNSQANGILITPEVAGEAGFNEFFYNRIHSHGDYPNLEHCVYVGTADNVFRGNEIYNCASAGITIYNGDGDVADRNQVLFNRVHDVGTAGEEGVAIQMGSGEDNYARGNQAWNNDTSYNATSSSVDSVFVDNLSFSSRTDDFSESPGATGTVNTNLMTTPGDFKVTNDPYAGVDWSTILHCQAQHHEHTSAGGRITALSNAGYCAATYMDYSGAYQRTQPDSAAWVAIGSPNPDPGVPTGWGEYRRWPAESYGAPSLPLNSLLFYLPGAEDVGLYASGAYGYHFYALGLTTYMEGAGCTSCGWSGSAVRTHNPLGLPAGQVFSSNQEFIDDATALDAMVTLNHPTGSLAGTFYDALSPFPRAVEMWNGYHAFYDEESAAGNECSLTPTTYIREMQAVWDHVLETKSARIWGVSANDWTGAWLPTGDPPGDCWPNITAANRDRGKLDVIVPTYSLNAYLEAFDAGAFFAVVEDNATKSAYPLVTRVHASDFAIEIETAQGDEHVTWIGNGLELGTGYTLALQNLPAGRVYLRAAIDDGAGRVTYTQPWELDDAQTRGRIVSSGTLGGGVVRTFPFQIVGQLLAGAETTVIAPGTASSVLRFAPAVDTAPVGASLVLRVQDASGGSPTGYIEATILAGSKVAVPASGGFTVAANATIFVRIVSGPTGASAASFLSGYFETDGFESAGEFTTLDELKTFASIGGSEHDAELQLIIERVTSAMQVYMQRDIVEQAYTEELYSMFVPHDALVLRNRPLLWVAEVRASGEVVDSTSYQIVAEQGYLYRAAGWPTGRFHLSVDYTAGYVAVPRALNRACLLQSRHEWTLAKNGADRFGLAQRAEASGGSTAFVAEDWYPGVVAAMRAFQRLA